MSEESHSVRSLKEDHHALIQVQAKDMGIAQPNNPVKPEVQDWG